MFLIFGGMLPLFTGCKQDNSCAMFRVVRCAFISAMAAFLVGDVAGQAAASKPPAPLRVEPGLENAVDWKWRVVPSDPKDWGLELPDLTHLAQATPTPTLGLPTEGQFTLYQVQRGDALFLIGKRFGVTVDQIKQANGLGSDLIRAGQTLKIPPPAPRPQRPPAGADIVAPKSKADKPARQETEAELNHVRLQVFLDREQFSSGPITGKPTATFDKVKFLYQSNRADAKDDAALEEKAKAAVGEVFAQYELKREDFRFIAPPRAETTGSARASRSRTAPSTRPSGSPALNKSPGGYERLIASSMLAYRSPWEFVAERFHCSETYLRALNSSLPAVPGIGAQFRVPNVIPFEIEKALQEPLQPQVDPGNPITAAIEGLSQLNIYRQGTLVAVFPLSIARPGLRGRGNWTILGAIPRPRLATQQEPWREVSKKPGPMFGSSTPTPTPIPIKPKLASEQLLAAGPRNPAGIIWIDLAKSDSPDPLPFGLHGTSIPDQMNTLESIGGLRLSNWDISRAVRLLPSGTPLEWKQ
jgi:LysM repeat protein/lipoprotein-anchoring transpeptidase ErfK/SrfK